MPVVMTMKHVGAPEDQPSCRERPAWRSAGMQPLDPTFADDPRPAVSSPLDEPIEAIVYDVYPALAPPRSAATNYDLDYPYGPPASFPPANCDPPAPIARLASSAAAWLAKTSESYFAALQSPPDFVVPKTFGMSAILGIIT